MLGPLLATWLLFVGPAGGVEGGVPGGVPGGVVGGEIGAGFEPDAEDESDGSDEDPEGLNPWVEAGARAWASCHRLGIEADSTLSRLAERILLLPDAHLWAARAMDCPHEPSVLHLAATQEVYRRFSLPERLDDAGAIETLRKEELESLAQAEQWLALGRVERRRRGVAPHPRAAYLAARIELVRGRPAAAEALIRPAMGRGEIKQWRARRLLALCALTQGRLQEAVEHALVAVRQGPAPELPLNRYIYALTLDRAGSSADGMRWLREAHTIDRDSAALFTVASMLPLHERIYLRALDRTARRDTTGALRWWDAYLARPEPEDPERRLAERHRQQLEPPPERLP